MNTRRRSSSPTKDSKQSNTRVFRRNRTITGSTSNRVSSSNELNASILSPRAHAHNLTKTRKKLSFYLLIVIFVSLGIYLVVSQYISKIVVGPPAGASLTIEQAGRYQQRIESYLNSRPLERFYPNLSKVGLEDYVSQQYPEVKQLDIELTGELGKAQFKPVFRQPVARWIIDGKQLYVDETGVVFSYNGLSKPAMEIIDENSNSESTVGASERLLQFVGTTVGAMNQYGLTVTSVKIPLLSARQLVVKVKSVPYEIKMYIGRPAGEQAEDAHRVVKYIENNKKSPKYIDVRTKQRAYYR